MEGPGIFLEPRKIDPAGNGKCEAYADTGMGADTGIGGQKPAA